jgi:hypothetical protein
MTARPQRTTLTGNLLTLAEVLDELRVPRSTFLPLERPRRAPRTIRYLNGSLYVSRRDLDARLNDHEEAA